jgi:hypothetical protein
MLMFVVKYIALISRLPKERFLFILSTSDNGPGRASTVLFTVQHLRIIVRLCPDGSTPE